MVSALILKLNGWPETFNERAKAIASHVDYLVLIRPKPLSNTETLDGLDNVKVFDLYPKRGSFVKPSWLKPIIYPIHVLQAILLMIYLLYRGKLPPVIHALDYALGGLACAVIRSLFAIQFVVSVRGLKEPRYKALVENERTLWASASYNILRMMTQFVLAKADHVVTKSEYQVEFVKENFEVNPGFTTVPTGVDFDVFDPKKIQIEHITEVLDFPADAIAENDEIVLYLAKLLPEKGPDKVLQLINKADNRLPPELKFVFVGEFRDTSFERHFNNLRRVVSARTILHDKRIPFEDVPTVLHSVDAVILLSESGTEGAPRILQESCAMQTPIVASDVTGISGSFNELPGCYLIDRDDPQQFSSAVNEAVSNPPEMPRELFADRFDMYKNYAKYGELYRTLSASAQSV